MEMRLPLTDGDSFDFIADLSGVDARVLVRPCALAGRAGNWSARVTHESVAYLPGL